MSLSLITLSLTAFATESKVVTVQRGESTHVLRQLPSVVTVDPEAGRCVVTYTWDGAKSVAALGACAATFSAAERDQLTAAVWEGQGPAGLIAELWVSLADRPGGLPIWGVLARPGVSLDLDGEAREMPHRAQEVPTTALPFDPAEVFKDADCDVRVEVGPSGLPILVAATQCDARVGDAIEVLLRSWRYQPWMIGGFPRQGAFELLASASHGAEGAYEMVLTWPTDATRGGASVHLTDRAVSRPPVERPTNPYVIQIRHKGFAAVRVHDIAMPEPWTGPEARSCPVLVGVNSRFEVVSWPEAGCHADVELRSVAAANAFRLTPAPNLAAERYARFRGVFRYEPNGGPVTLDLPSPDIEKGSDELPDGVHGRPAAVVLRSISPRFESKGEASCTVDVNVSRSGRPKDLKTDAACPTDMVAASLKAIKRWRWVPPLEDGRPTTIRTRVTVRRQG